MTSTSHADTLEALDLFGALNADARRDIAGTLMPISLKRGTVLIEEGGAADALYIVVSGRFAVTKAGSPAPLYEIGSGQPVGEIAFVAGGVRTATVTALRDSLVLKLDRNAFDALAARNPSIWPALAATLARRLSVTSGRTPLTAGAHPRTIAVVRAGSSAIPPAFIRHLVHVFSRAARTRFVGPRFARDVVSNGVPFESSDTIKALNDLETAADYVVFFADTEVTEWSKKVIRQADLVLLVGLHAADPKPNPLEEFANQIVPPASRRLALLHPRRTKITGTSEWLKDRNVAMHHHVALDTDGDAARLFRFISGTARGLVACGGGALCAAQIGVWRALVEAGVSFDIMGGTSAGSAFAAGFALGATPDRMTEVVQDIFVSNGGMQRYTIPRYGLLDHVHFDAQLKRHFGGVDIEDLWIPYFAVATDLSAYAIHCQTRGSLWSAIRASSSIPVLLPPFYTDDGRMLVDGCLLDNVPIRVMHEIKQGPNIVIALELPRNERFKVNYTMLPSRSDLLKATVFWTARRKLPEAPGVATVLMRSLMANRNDFQRHMGPEDQLLMPELPAGASFLDWHRHRDLSELAYRSMRGTLNGEAARGIGALFA